MKIIIEVPDGPYCEQCPKLSRPDPRGEGRFECGLFPGRLGNHLTNVFKHPECIASGKEEKVNNLRR